jgi:hypothetical protein
MYAKDFAVIIRRASSNEPIGDVDLEKNDDKNRESFMKQQQIILNELSNGTPFDIRMDTIEFQLADDKYLSEKFIASIVSLGYKFLEYSVSKSNVKTAIFGVREDIIYHVENITTT